MKTTRIFRDLLGGPPAPFLGSQSRKGRRPNAAPRRVQWVQNWGGGASLVLSVLLFAPRPALAVKDLPNFHAVAPHIWRGAAPTVSGLRRLKAMGVATVIDLRISPRLVRRERAEALALGFRWINLPMGADPPTPKQVATLLAALDDAPQHPVFVHCQHGADRTGCMVGIYRETRQGWTFPQAWAEMRRDGFDPRWTRLSASVRARAKPSAP